MNHGEGAKGRSREAQSTGGSIIGAGNQLIVMIQLYATQPLLDVQGNLNGRSIAINFVGINSLNIDIVSGGLLGSIDDNVGVSILDFRNCKNQLLSIIFQLSSGGNRNFHLGNSRVLSYLGECYFFLRSTVRSCLDRLCNLDNGRIGCVLVVGITKAVALGGHLSCQHSQVEVDLTILILIGGIFIHVDDQCEVMGLTVRQEYVTVRDSLSTLYNALTLGSVPSIHGCRVGMCIGNNSVLHNLIQVILNAKYTQSNGVLEVQIAVILDCQVSHLGLTGLPKSVGVVILGNLLFSNRIHAENRLLAVADVYVVATIIHLQLHVQFTGYDLVAIAGSRVREPRISGSEKH